MRMMREKMLSPEEETLLAIKFLIYFIVGHAECEGRNSFRTKMALQKAFEMTGGYLEDEIKNAFRTIWW